MKSDVPLQSDSATRFLFHPEWARIAISTKLSTLINTASDHILIVQVSYDIVIQPELLFEEDGLATLGLGQ